MPVIELPGGFRWEQHDVQTAFWQAHLLKHPLGLRALRWRPPRRWNHEGWDELEPPAITEAQRASFAAEIGKLTLGGQRCAVEELRGGPVATGEPECYECKPPLLVACRDLLAKIGLPARYGAEAEGLAYAVADAEVVPREKLTSRLFKSLQHGELFKGLVLMSVGRADGYGRPIVRISSAGGARLELYIEGGGRLRLRTHYRQRVQGSIRDTFNFVTAGAERDPKLSLSEAFFVARDWVNRHGI